MKLLWAGDVHYELTKCMSKAFHALNVQIAIPGADYQVTHWPDTRRWVWGDQWSLEYAKKHLKYNNALILNKEQILDWKPDCIIITCYESSFEVLYELIPKLPKTIKVAFFSGNNYWEGAFPWYLIKNYLAADLPSHNLCKKHNIANHLWYRPFVDYQTFKYNPASSMTVGSYICDFERNFPDCYKFSRQLEAQVPEIKHNFHTKSTRDEVWESMNNSIATSHIKVDGYGYSIIQSMAVGRPVFVHRDLAKQCSYQNWCIEGETAFYISSPAEYRAKLKALIDSPDYRNWVHYNCAQKIREYINNENETEKLGKFLENLQ